MRFAPSFTFLLALATGAHAEISANTLIDSIYNITQISAQTNDIATNIKLINVPRLGEEVLNNLRIIVQMVKDDLDAIFASDSSVSEESPDCLNVTNVQECMRENQKMSEKSGQVNGVETRQAAPPYTERNQQFICNSLAEFVKVHKLLLSTVIGKSGLLSKAFLTRPIAAVLRALESVVDRLAYKIISFIPSCADDTQDRIASLDQKFQEAKAAYGS